MSAPPPPRRNNPFDDEHSDDTTRRQQADIDTQLRQQTQTEQALSIQQQPNGKHPMTSAAPVTVTGVPVPVNPHLAITSPAPSQNAEAQLQAIKQDDEQNLKIAQINGANVEILIDQKRANQLKQAKVVSNLQAQYELVKKQEQKLAFIKTELLKLDQSLAKNIDILRSEIEVVGRDVIACQRDFDIKERDYLAARKLLAQKKQRKLLLTGHLDYIILTNERNKANKLAELERQLELSDGNSTAITTSTPSTDLSSVVTAESMEALIKHDKPMFAGFDEKEIQNFKV